MRVGLQAVMNEPLSVLYFHVELFYSFSAIGGFGSWLVAAGSFGAWIGKL